MIGLRSNQKLRLNADLSLTLITYNTVTHKQCIGMNWKNEPEYKDARLNTSVRYTEVFDDDWLPF